MTCTAVHVRRGPSGYPFEDVACRLDYPHPRHAGYSSIGVYTWDDLHERARMALAASPWMVDVDDSNAAEVLARNTTVALEQRASSKCEGCGVEFVPKRRDKPGRFHSVACRWGWVA